MYRIMKYGALTALGALLTVPLTAPGMAQSLEHTTARQTTQGWNTDQLGNHYVDAGQHQGRSLAQNPDSQQDSSQSVNQALQLTGDTATEMLSNQHANVRENWMKGNGPYTTPSGYGWGSKVGYSGQNYSNSYVPNGYQSNMPLASQNGRFTNNEGNQPYPARQLSAKNSGNTGVNSPPSSSLGRFAMANEAKMASSQDTNIRSSWESANGPYTTSSGYGWGSKVGYSGQNYSNGYVPNGYQSNMPFASQRGQFTNNQGNQPYPAFEAQRHQQLRPSGNLNHGAEASSNAG